MITAINPTRNGTQTKTYEELICSPSLVAGSQHQSLYIVVVKIILSITAFLGNSLILVALNKETSLHPPSKLLYRCLAITDLLVGLVAQPLQAIYWMSVVHDHWNLCRYLNDAASIAGYALCALSLLTTTAISVDRLLALLLGLRYRKIVTLKRAYIIVATFWILTLIDWLCIIVDPRITFWYGRIVMATCLVISLASYTKIFRTLRSHQAQVQDRIEQQPSQPEALNFTRYRKAVYSALWVQLALVICYAPFYIVAIVIAHSKTHSSHLVVIWRVSVALLYFNSTLNPFLYCWKISEVRQAMKQTIRQAFCCPRS